MGYYSAWPKYVPVAERKRQADKKVAKLKKSGIMLNPIVITGRAIAKTFWGKAWCENLESYSDFENRLPRGRTYVRNGSVIDLQISKGAVSARVSGSSIYEVSVQFASMASIKWLDLVSICSGKISSLIELLQGKFSKNVMEILTEKERGLFPKPQEITMRCSCPDYAGMCKHIAAVLYGVGALLDDKPEHLFQLRHVDHIDLIAASNVSDGLIQGVSQETALADEDLSSLFGIEMDVEEPKKVKKSAPKKTERKKATVKKTVKKRSSKRTE